MSRGLFVVRGSGSKGGFATTFDARSPTGEIVLVKVADGTGSEAVSSARREYQLLRQAHALDDRFPRPILLSESASATGGGCGDVRGRAVIVMERICGPTLRQVNRAGHYLDEGEGARVARDLVEQEGVIADLGYCHHDVTPSNVVLDVFRSCARLIDLGTASRLDVDDGVRVRGGYQRPDERSRPLGTPPSPLTDLYSTALVLREACWGDLLSAGRDLPPTPLSRWVGRVLEDGFPSLDAALRAL